MQKISRRAKKAALQNDTHIYTIKPKSLSARALLRKQKPPPIHLGSDFQRTNRHDNSAKAQISMSNEKTEERIPLGYEFVAVAQTEPEALILCSSLRQPFYCLSENVYHVYQLENKEWPTLPVAAPWITTK